jgi:ubiquinone/menaquinone biosynthesis C-methylase UbiE
MLLKNTEKSSMSHDKILRGVSMEYDNYYMKARPEMINYIPKDAKKILEVGCGSGTFSYQLNHPRLKARG